MISIVNFNPQCITYSQMNMIFNSRIFWKKLGIWTRSYIIGRYTGIGAEEELFGRLYLESHDIGLLLRILFGRGTADGYAHNFDQLAITLRDLITAQLQGDQDAVVQNVDRLYQAVDASAAHLASINPYCNEEEWRSMLRDNLLYTLEDANSLVANDFSADAEAYDRLSEVSIRLGDFFAQQMFNYITSGIEPQDGSECITYDQMNEIYGVRMFWFELAVWVRNYMLSRYEGIGNPDEASARLRQVLEDYVARLRQFFGESPGADALMDELYAFQDLLGDLITAQMKGDEEEVDRITRLLYQNADDRAASVSSINPFWDQEEWRNRLYSNLRRTIEESESFLTEDYMKNIDAFSMLLNLADSASGYFAEGMFRYLISRQNEQIAG
ncbi:MAG TPA: hypothetical protein PKA19_10595 [Bacillota bacterium]|nr:hypothetical protein [Bacillota bacterium]